MTRVGPALDLEFLLNYVMNEVKPLDWQRVVDSPVPLKVRFFAPTFLSRCPKLVP